MKQDKDWIDVMRRELRDAEIPPPVGGWERLEHDLAKPGAGIEAAPAASRGSVMRVYWPRIVAAAAAVLLCVGAGEYLWHTQKKGLEQDGFVITSATDGGGSAAEIPVLPSATEPAAMEVAQVVVPRPRNAVSRPAAAGQTSSQLVQAAPASGQESAEHNTTTAQVAAKQTSEQPAEHSPKEKSTAGHSQAEHSAAPATRRTVFSDEPFVAYTAPRKKTSVSLFGAGGVTGSGTSTGPLAGLMMDNVSTSVGGEGVSALQRYEYGESSFRHHQPLSFGLAVRKEFAHGLSLESGVNYTLLRSDVSVKYASEDVSQRLHFIGVPLRVNWVFLERRRFSLYIGAGGMVEKCVAAKLGSKSVDEPGVQWSVLGAAGAQYDLGGVVGLYFEPEAAYYFNDTSLRTSRTDSPLTLTLRLGVRLSF